MKKEIWTAEKMWTGETVFILGGGPSLADVNKDLIKHRNVIAVNNAYGDPVINSAVANDTGSISNDLPAAEQEYVGGAHRYVPRDWVDVCFYGDERWYGWHRKDLKSFTGKIISMGAQNHGRGSTLALYRGMSEGIEERTQYLAWNKSSGGAAVGLAYHLGASTCVLLGYDMRRVPLVGQKKETRANWHTDHPAPDKDPYARFLLPWKKVKQDADRLGMRIVNCTPDSALKVFPIMSLKEFLNAEKST